MYDICNQGIKTVTIIFKRKERGKKGRKGEEIRKVNRMTGTHQPLLSCDEVARRTWELRTCPVNTHTATPPGPPDSPDMTKFNTGE